MGDEMNERERTAREHRDVESQDRAYTDDRAVEGRDRRTADRTVVDRGRQRDEFGGFNLGAAFFGWLVAIGIAVLLTALLSAAGAAIGLTELSGDEVDSNAETLSIVGGALLVLVLALAYYAGGYVAGRMSRFDGARQGIGVWVLGIVVTILLAVLGAVAGSEYNVLNQLDLPRIPIDEGSLATGAIIALLAALVLTALASILGGKVGERYHRRVDRAGASFAEHGEEYGEGSRVRR
jgi:hypothetical protein